MNKVEVKDSNYTRGNHALKPKKKISTPKKTKELDKLKKLRKDKKNKLRDKKKNSKKSVSLIIVMIFVLGITIIWRDASVFSLQNKLTQLNKEIKNMKVDNEALKVDLLKSSSIETVKNTAESNLKMVIPSKDEVIRIEEKQNIEIPKEKSSDDKNKSWLTKIKDALKR